MDYKEKNNTLIVDLILKSNRILFLLNHLLDANNGNNLPDLNIEPDFYNELQDLIIKVIGSLNKKVTEYFKEVQNVTGKDNRKDNKQINKNE